MRKLFSLCLFDAVVDAKKAKNKKILKCETAKGMRHESLGKKGKSLEFRKIFSFSILSFHKSFLPFVELFFSSEKCCSGGVLESCHSQNLLHLHFYLLLSLFACSRIWKLFDATLFNVDRNKILLTHSNDLKWEALIDIKTSLKQFLWFIHCSAWITLSWTSPETLASALKVAAIKREKSWHCCATWSANKSAKA